MYLQSFFVLTLCASAAFCDLRTGKISNAFILAGIGTGVCLSLSGTVLAAGKGASLLFPSIFPAPALLRLPECLLGTAIPLILGFPLFHIRALGAGDIKLLMAVGSLIGSRSILPFLAASVLCGSAVAIPLLIAGWGLKGRFHFSVPILMAAMLYSAGLL